MIDHLFFALTLLCVLGTGVMAGLFFTFSTFMMTALGRLPPAQGVAAMQSINVAILNPLFAVAFFGTAVACLALAVATIFRWPDPGAIWLLLGCALYLAGSVLVTILFNVPMNEALAAAAPDSVEAADLWQRYLVRWTAWNHVRTIANVAALAAFLLAVYLGTRSAAT